MPPCPLRCPIILKEIIQALEKGEIELPEKLAKKQQPSSYKHKYTSKFHKRIQSPYKPSQETPRRASNALEEIISEIQVSGLNFEEVPKNTELRQLKNEKTLSPKNTKDNQSQTNTITEYSKEVSHGSDPTSKTQNFQNESQPSTSKESNNQIPDNKTVRTEKLCTYGECQKYLPFENAKERIAQYFGEHNVCYLLNGLSYFDVCLCSITCIVNSIRRDNFTREIFFALLVFVVGIKLSLELEGWYIPLRV